MKENKNTEEATQLPASPSTIPQLKPKMPADMFEPKAAHRFIFRFDKIDPFLVKKVDIPEFIVMEKSIQQSKEITFYLNCPAEPSAELQVLNTIATQNSENGLAPVKVEFLSSAGEKVSEYNFENPKIISFKISDLDYTKKELLEIVVKFSYSAFRILS